MGDETDRKDRWIARVSIPLGAAFLMLLAYPQRERVLAGQNDFAPLYAGAKLAFSPKLYDGEATRAIIREIHNYDMPAGVFVRPAYYALMLHPLTWLPYQWAYWLFSFLNLAAAGWFVWLFRRWCPELPVYTAFSIPVLTALCNGQDTLLVLALAAGSVWLAAQGRDRAAGILLGLCSIKFHLFLLLPLVLIVRRRWAMFKSAAVLVSVLSLAMCFLCDAAWIPSYLGVLRNPEITPDPQNMPSLYGILLGAAGDRAIWIYVVFALLIAATCLYLAHKAANYEYAFAAALVGGVLISMHVAAQDCVVLLLVLAIVAGRARSPGVLAVSALATLPPVYMLVLAGWPYNTALPALLIAWILAAMVSSRRHGAANQTPARSLQPHSTELRPAQ